MKKTIDFNADVGEGLNNEALLMPYLHSCNIACGGHAGNRETMKTVMTLANHHGVKVGAHPSFPDKENFGRLPMQMGTADLFTVLKKQIQEFKHVLHETGTRFNHLKAHGALYNMSVHDKKVATVILEVVKSVSAPIKLYLPFGSVIANLAQHQRIPVVYEVFADRNYNEDLSLVSRSMPMATIENPQMILEHVQRMIGGKVKSINGHLVNIEADTICIHGDNPNAIEILKYLTKNMPQYILKSN